MVFFKPFRITGENNAQVLDVGLHSTETEKKRLLSVIIQVTGYSTPNEIVGYHETAKVFALPDSLIDTTEQFTDTNEAKSYNRLNEIEVMLDMPIGTIFQVGILSGATKKDLVGAYRYEIIE